jgi:hypothetical protein
VVCSDRDGAHSQVAGDKGCRLGEQCGELHPDTLFRVTAIEGIRLRSLETPAPRCARLPQVVSKQPCSIKCDVWSLGVLVWELATGHDITEYQPLAVSRQLGLQVCVCVE